MMESMTFSLFNITCLCLVTICLYSCVDAQRRLCGEVLANTLDLVCEGRGFHFSTRNGRSIDVPKGKYTASNSQQRNSEIILNKKYHTENGTLNNVNTEKKNKGHIQIKASDLDLSTLQKRPTGQSMADLGTMSQYPQTDDVWSRIKRHIRRKRTIVDECCHQACSFSTLESYCAASSDPDIEMSLIELRHRLGFTTPRPPTERPPVVITQRPILLPSAQINRDEGRGRNISFFYVSIGKQATRSPLLQ